MLYNNKTFNLDIINYFLFFQQCSTTLFSLKNTFQKFNNINYLEKKIRIKYNKHVDYLLEGLFKITFRIPAFSETTVRAVVLLYNLKAHGKTTYNNYITIIYTYNSY